jgi:hypothetical protein
LRNISLPLHNLRLSSDRRSRLRQCRLTEKHVCGGGISSIYGRDVLRKHLPPGCLFEAKGLFEKGLFLEDIPMVVEREGRAS